MSKHLLTFWDEQYKAKVGARYPVNGGKDGKLLKDLRAIYSDEDITRFMSAFFEMEDPFFAEAGWSLGAFRSCLPKVIAWVNRKGSVAINWKAATQEEQRRARVMQTDTWKRSVGSAFPQPVHWQWCEHEPKCATSDDCRLQVECQHDPKCWTLNECRELRHKAS